VRKYQIVLITNDKVDITADGFEIDYGCVVFYKYVASTPEEKYPDNINIMSIAAGTWTLVIVINE